MHDGVAGAFMHGRCGRTHACMCHWTASRGHCRAPQIRATPGRHMPPSQASDSQHTQHARAAVISTTRITTHSGCRTHGTSGSPAVVKFISGCTLRDARVAETRAAAAWCLTPWLAELRAAQQAVGRRWRDGCGRAAIGASERRTLGRRTTRPGAPRASGRGGAQRRRS